MPMCHAALKQYCSRGPLGQHWKILLSCSRGTLYQYTGPHVDWQYCSTVSISTPYRSLGPPPPSAPPAPPPAGSGIVTMLKYSTYTVHSVYYTQYSYILPITSMQSTAGYLGVRQVRRRPREEQGRGRGGRARHGDRLLQKPSVK